MNLTDISFRISHTHVEFLFSIYTPVRDSISNSLWYDAEKSLWNTANPIKNRASVGRYVYEQYESN